MLRNSHGFPDPYLCPLPAEEQRRALDLAHGFAGGVVVFGPLFLAALICWWCA